MLIALPHGSIFSKPHFIPRICDTVTEVPDCLFDILAFSIKKELSVKLFKLTKFWYIINI